MYDYDNREDFEDYGKHCWLLTPWKGYRSATIVGQTDRLYRPSEQRSGDSGLS